MTTTFVLKVYDDDLPIYTARVVKIRHRHWDADYFRDGELIGTGLIATGHDDLPVTIVANTLESYRDPARPGSDCKPR